MKMTRRAATAELTTAADGSMMVQLAGELDHDGVVVVEGAVQRAAATVRTR